MDPLPPSTEQLAQLEKEMAMQSMKDKIDQSFGDPLTRQLVIDDFMHTFQATGLSQQESADAVAQLETELCASRNLSVIEPTVFKLTNSLRVGERPFIDVLHEKLAERANILFSQVYPQLKDIQGPIIDYGAGDFQVTKRLADAGLDMTGCDIRDYRGDDAKHLRRLDILPGSRLAIPDQSVEAAVLTNVLHHEKDNERIIEELTRVVSKRLVIMETVPLEGDEPMQTKMDRTFMNDYLYNRVFHNADVPVPGAFETPENWVARFAKHGWVLKYEQDYEIDQPTIKDRHYLLVFERAGEVS